MNDRTVAAPINPAEATSPSCRDSACRIAVSRDGCYTVLLDQGQQFERWAGWPLFPPLPLAHKVRGDVELVREHRLADALALPDGLDLLR